MVRPWIVPVSSASQARARVEGWHSKRGHAQAVDTRHRSGRARSPNAPQGLWCPHNAAAGRPRRGRAPNRHGATACWILATRRLCDRVRAAIRMEGRRACAASKAAAGRRNGSHLLSRRGARTTHARIAGFARSVHVGGVSMQLGGARLLGEAHCAAPVRSKSTALRLRTAGGNERSAVKSSAVRCENRPQCGEIERSAHGKRPHSAHRTAAVRTAQTARSAAALRSDRRTVRPRCLLCAPHCAPHCARSP